MLNIAPDPETPPNHREALSARACVVPRITLGPAKIEPGGSLQYSVIDRSEFVLADLTIIPEATGEQVVIGTELSVSLWRELLSEQVLAPTCGATTDLVAQELTSSSATQSGSLN